MKLPQTAVRVVVVATFLAICSLASFADSNNDPRVVIKDANPGQRIDGLSFQFSLPTYQGRYFSGDLNFTNNSSSTWTTLALFVSSAITNVSCSGAGSGIFNDCSTFIDPNNHSLTEMLFSNVVGFGRLGTGVLPCENFTLDFSGTGGSNEWPSGTRFSGTANVAVPEPATLAFLLTGIAAIIARRRFSKSAILVR